MGLNSSHVKMLGKCCDECDTGADNSQSADDIINSIFTVDVIGFNDNTTFLQDFIDENIYSRLQDIRNAC